MSVLNIANEISEFSMIDISLVYCQYNAMTFSLHYSIKYFKSNNIVSLEYFESFLPLMHLFRKDFQRNVQHSIQMLHITKRIGMFISFLELYWSCATWIKMKGA